MPSGAGKCSIPRNVLKAVWLGSFTYSDIGRNFWLDPVQRYHLGDLEGGRNHAGSGVLTDGGVGQREGRKKICAAARGVGNILRKAPNRVRRSDDRQYGTRWRSFAEIKIIVYFRVSLTDRPHGTSNVLEGIVWYKVGPFLGNNRIWQLQD